MESAAAALKAVELLNGHKADGKKIKATVSPEQVGDTWNIRRGRRLAWFRARPPSTRPKSLQLRQRRLNRRIQRTW
ncbi:hypothetical protein DL89DRAFT_21711 [Linderina pennispora]|uniref:RRM domain-containing protein n=1 Tax=Linderina pennispora TaxID=61395 RepID=A0A1Y1WMC2_9FUNG|nr:uncharacterized protein DL89DRAFT_21711 [Linderina pennispora]ORX74711.1 hypothetical protein DL89DRAFT_21711 [Linderina pennispora]